MAALTGLEPRACAALALLVWAARRERGWCWGGVRGWLFHRELKAVVQAAGLQMPCTYDALTRRGLITCREVRDTGGGCLHLYRAQDPGARALDAALGKALGSDTRVLEADPRDDPRTLFTPLGAWVALAALRDARRTGRRRWEAHGWLTSAEISVSLGAPAHFDTTDLYWLERRGLIEKRYGQIPARSRRPPVYWRATSPGRRARLVDHFGIASGVSALLQVSLGRQARSSGHDERQGVSDLVAAYRASLALPSPSRVRARGRAPRGGGRMIAHAAARRRADELTAAGDPGQGGDAASLEARQRVRHAPGEPDLGGLQAALASIARETARLLVEDPPGAELRVNELDARAGALRAAIREVSLARAPRDPDWLPDDVRMAERALRESGRGVAADG